MFVCLCVVLLVSSLFVRFVCVVVGVMSEVAAFPQGVSGSCGGTLWSSTGSRSAVKHRLKKLKNTIWS